MEPDAETKPLAGVRLDADALLAGSTPVADLVGEVPLGLSGSGAREWTRSFERSLRGLQPASREFTANHLADRLPGDAPWRRVLRDPTLDAQLRSEGWARLRVLEPGEASTLYGAYGDLHGWVALDGFEPDPGNGDRRYRARVREVLGRAIDGRLAEALVDHVPFLQGYYAKWPNTPATDLHADWTCVREELGHRSYIVWTALQPTEPRNGGMGVLPRSHRVHRGPRGSNLNLPLPPAWDGFEQEIWEQLLPVPLDAGEALVFDMGIVHASYPNDSDTLRLAAVTCLRPREADLVYYRSTTDGLALRFEVDEEFYLEQTPAQLVETLPGRVPVDVVADRDPGVEARRDALLTDLARRRRRRARPSTLLRSLRRRG